MHRTNQQSTRDPILADPLHQHLAISCSYADVIAFFFVHRGSVRYNDDRELYGYALDRRVALLVKAVEKGGPSHLIPIHAFNGDRDGGVHLLDMMVQEDIMVTEFKQKLAERLREDGPEAYRECVGDHLRVRECGYLVFMDHQTVIQAVKNFAGGERFAVSMIDGPETKTEPSQAVLSL